MMGQDKTGWGRKWDGAAWVSVRAFDSKDPPFQVDDLMKSRLPLEPNAFKNHPHSPSLKNGLLIPLMQRA